MRQREAHPQVELDDQVEVVAAKDDGSDPQARVEESELEALIASSLRSLPLAYRSALVLRYDQGLSY